MKLNTISCITHNYGLKSESLKFKDPIKHFMQDYGKEKLKFLH
jgi:hypothetical protein